MSAEIDVRAKHILEHGLNDEVWRLLQSPATLPAGGGDSAIEQCKDHLQRARAYMSQIRDDVHTLKKLCNSMDTIGKATSEAATTIRQSEQGTQQYLTAAEQLESRRAALAAAKARFEDLQRAYAMDPDTSSVLSAGPDHPDFFPTFSTFRDRVERAQSGSLLSGVESEGSRVELAMAVEHLSRQAGERTAAALDKTLQYCLRQLKDESTFDSLFSDMAAGGAVMASGPAAKLVTAVQLMAHLAPELCKTVQAAYVHSRRSTLLRDLLMVANPQSAAATSISGERFVSDILAWLRTRVLEEQEAIGLLFGQMRQGRQDGVPDAEPFGDSLPALLSSIGEGIARPLGARLEWAVTSQDEPVPLLRVMDVLGFYGQSFAGMLQATSAVCGAIHASHAQCRARLDTLSAVLAARIKSSVPAYATGLGASTAVVDTGLLMADICKTVASGGMGKDGQQAADAQRQSAARSCMDTLVHAALDSTASAAAGLNEEDGLLLQLNAAASLQSALSPYAIAASIVQRLAGEVAGHEESVVAAVSSRILTDSGVLRVLSTVRSGQAAGLATTEVESCTARFISLLSSPSTLRFDAVSDPRVRQRVRRDTAGVLSAAYATVYTGTQSGTAKPSLPRSPAEVDILLDLQ